MSYQCIVGSQRTTSGTATAFNSNGTPAWAAASLVLFSSNDEDMPSAQTIRTLIGFRAADSSATILLLDNSLRDLVEQPLAVHHAEGRRLDVLHDDPVRASQCGNALLFVANLRGDQDQVNRPRGKIVTRDLADG